jgi:hypothetical protein
MTDSVRAGTEYVQLRFVSGGRYGVRTADAFLE